MVNSIVKEWQGTRALLAGLVLALVGGLLIGGSLPLAVGLVAQPWDKVAHVVVFAVLACAIGLASRREGVTMLVVGFAGAMLIGGADELLQMWTPGRQADLDDLLADAVGAALGTLPLAVRVHLHQLARIHDHPLSSG